MDGKNLDCAREVAGYLLKSRAVILSPRNPFTWASGKLSPIYCNNRRLLKDYQFYSHVNEWLANLIMTEYPDVKVLMGTATAGIPHSSITAYILQMPFGYVRSTAKDHGLCGKIEGADVSGLPVVVVEDLISTSKSSLGVVETLRQAGANVLGISSIFTYDLQEGLDNLSAANVRNESLTDIHVLLEEAVSSKYITQEEYACVKAFLKDPDNSNWMNV